jgi:hypothetical protein
MLELRFDDQRFRAYVKAIVEDILNDHGLLPAETSGRASGTRPNSFFVSSRYYDDVLSQVQAPDADFGARREPHWMVVRRMAEGDQVFFRDASARAIVGYGTVGTVRKGFHPHEPDQRAIIVAMVHPIRFKRPIEDVRFRDVFEKHGGNRPDFPLFDGHGHYARKTYAYPLPPDLADELIKLGTSPVG